jgi:hypothetical protein
VGHGFDPHEAFARLAGHIEVDHPDEDDKLMAFRIESELEEV